MYINTYLVEVKKLISVYFNRYGKRVVKDKRPEKISELIKFYLNILQNNNIPFDLKPEIKVGLGTLMDMESNKGFKI